MSSTMFRTQALKRVSSPEQLDRVVRAALPLQWLALVALLVVVGTVVAWSAIATVATTVPGNGAYVPLGGLRVIDATAAGTVANVAALRVGASVEAGEVIGTISDPAAVGTGPGTNSVNVLSPVTGTVVEVNDISGTFVAAGQGIAIVEPAGQPLVIYAYVPTEVASGLPPGVPVQVTFGAGIGATFGYVKGVVASVGRYPVSVEHVSSVLGGPLLANQVAKLGPANEVVIALLPSRQTPSGLIWASGQGPPGKLPAGLPSSVKFILGSHHPISDVL